MMALGARLAKRGVAPPVDGDQLSELTPFAVELRNGDYRFTRERGFDRLAACNLVHALGEWAEARISPSDQ